jgi:hypothetical protein
MKKLFALSVVVFCILAFAGNFAQAESDESEKVEISFKVGDETLKINNKDVTVEKPYVVNGVTLVPLRVITEAFGAEVTWNGADKSIVLKYKDVLIKLVVGSKEADVDGKKSTILQAPVINNNVTMVPLRFITENFGADVNYDNKTQRITVLKEIANSNSIKDFGLILKKTNKSKVGDSYYNWSLSLPKKLKMSYRNFNGTSNRFLADDESYVLSINIGKLRDETLESLLAEEIEYAKNLTIQDQGIRSVNGQDYVKCVAKGENITYEDRIYIKNNRIYYVSVGVPDYNNYKNNKDLAALLDSFSLDFVKDGNTEDLSDINADGLRKYENKKLKWSIMVQPDMYEIKSNDKENVVTFIDENANAVVVNMYSIEDGLTLDKWMENEQKYIKDKYNSELFKIESLKDDTINGVKCKRMLCSFKYPDNTMYSDDIYIIGENYRYEFAYLLKEESYNNSETRKKFESMLSTFKFSEPDEDEVGKLVDPDKIKMSDSVRKIENKKYKWSLELPVSWIESEDSTDGTAIYENDSTGSSLMIMAMKSNPTENFVAAFEESSQERLKTEKRITVDKKEDLNDKGTVVKKYSLTINNEDSILKEYDYALSKNGYDYYVVFIIDNIYYNEKNLNIADTIWKSLKFE